MEAAGGLLISAVGLIMTGGIMHFIRHAVTHGTLERNPTIGIRTRVTQSSDLVWKAGHEAAVPLMSVAAWAGYFFGVSTVAVAIVGLTTGTGGPVALVLPFSGYLGIVTVTVASAVRANKAGAQAVRDAERTGES